MFCRLAAMKTDNFSSCNVVICDDSITNVMILAKVLENEGIRNVHSFTDPRKVLPFIRECNAAIDLLVLDIEMPFMSGFEVMNAIHAELSGRDVLFPILIITGSDDKDVRYEALLSGASDFITKPIDQTEVVLRVKNMLRFHRALKAQTNIAAQLEIDVEKRTNELNKANDLLIQLLALAGEMRDNETGRHVARVGRFSRIVAEGAGLPAELCFMIEKASPLHDLGKIGIPDSILHKNGRLDEDERKLMNSHTEMGLKLLGEYGQDSMLLQLASSIALNHHERWDGGGYPRGMRGESIPIEGRIVAIADVFDALTTLRPYKEPWPIEKVVAFFEENAGKQFDPTLVKVLVANLEKFVATMVELRDGEGGASQPALVAATPPQETAQTGAPPSH
jgi:putative two-component system response regulator